ncbi:Z1 domain-containing protein [Nitrosospira multiformis]|uniref:Z1 domain-containing protein n=1 Tax=Nitrosospira multiformis TaxID=1231 RepID=UPI001C31948F|nr:Z1 domain-containing protein [Nitrosospira multiformis]
MKITAEEIKQKVVKFVQELLLDEEDRCAITPALIAAKIDMVVAMKPSWGEDLHRDAVTDELIRRFSLWIGQNTTLRSDVGHVPWLNSSRKQDWRYWQRYREWLERKLSWKAVEALNKSTDSILELLEDPTREGHWDRRGLVVGHVQSGKTGSYTGLICKAADAGYKIIIVLAGLHNNLRSQTQIRLEEGFLGYKTLADRETASVIGVGEIDSDKNIYPNCATNRSNAGDFSTRIARHLAISPEERPWLFVVKKNKTVLRELLKWVQNHAADTNLPRTDGLEGFDDGLPRVQKIVTKLPLLIIDDEADHASVDTQEQVFDADGNPDEEHSPTTINRLIRRLLHSFSRAAYIGYTATPFANIFIHERGETREEGPDLFPSSFIINLAAPSNYIGPAQIFGLLSPEGRQGGLPLVRHIRDHASEDGRSGWMPIKHRNGHQPLYNGFASLPPSLVEAIDAFVLACAARRVRGHESEHCSMLVHVTRFNSVQREVHRQVVAQIEHMRQRILRSIDHEQTLIRMKSLWETDFIPNGTAIRKAQPNQTSFLIPSWDKILAVLPDAISDIEIRMINGTAKDALDYDEHDGSGLKVIAIGGDKLSRGLTLNGLCVSYFLRASRMYDTLMQMGRWFGYRPDYLDLCRSYTTTELSDWFGHITDAAEELREEFDLMAASGATPRDYGLKVQSHSVLMVTSRLKMRAARNLMLSFSGQLLETVSLYRDPSILEHNFRVTRRLLCSLNNPEVNPVRIRAHSRQEWKGFLWHDVAVECIVDFLMAYRTHPEAYKVNSVLIAEFVQSMAIAGELIRWTIALIGGGEGTAEEICDGIKVNMLKRVNSSSSENRYSIGRLISPRDEAIDLDEAAWEAALTATRQSWHADPARHKENKEPELPNGLAVRTIRGFGANGVAARPDRGLLLLYALDPKLADPEPDHTPPIFPPDTPPIIAFGVSFPGSNSGFKVQYKVNNVLWEQEYGAAE